MVEISLEFPRGTGLPTDIDNVNRLFDHRLERDDLDQILAILAQTERSVLVAKMGDLLRRVSALLDVQNQVSDTLSLDVMLARLIKIITNVLDADRRTLFFSNNKTDELWSQVLEGAGMNKIRLLASAGPAGSCFHNREPFEDALGFRVDDGPSRLYLERAKFYESDPPADDWDGVWTMLEK